MAAVSVSRKTSLAESRDGSLIDSSLPLDTDHHSPTYDFTAPIDAIYALVKNAYDKRIKISAKDIQDVERQMHEMKNRIINHLLLKDKEKTPKVKEPETSLQYRTEWPLPTHSRTNREKCHATVTLKSSNDSKLEPSDVQDVESKVNELLSTEKIQATIHSSFANKAGDVVIKFNENDDVNTIARKVENSLGYKANCRSILLPKMTISYVPKYLSVKESVANLIVRSNKWLEEMVSNGENFEVLFTYEVKDWSSIVCRMSPKIRTEIMLQGNSLKIENRLCPVKDRFHALQCGNCLGFGHKTNVCKKDVPSCSHCGEGHRWKDCPHKENEEKQRCFNCEKNKDENETTKNDKRHGASSRLCPIYLNQLKKQIERTRWGVGPIPTI